MDRPTSDLSDDDLRIAAGMRIAGSRLGTAARPIRSMRTRSRWSRCATPSLLRVELDDDLLVMGMLVDRRDELGRAHTQTINRLHRLLLELFPGGAPQFLSSHKARAMIATIRPRDLVGKTRRRLAVELIVELEAIDKRIRAVKKELAALVQARGSTLMGLTGIGPSGAARLLADVGDIHRFADRDRFASWNGTAPLDASSGDQKRHRLSRAGNRRINRTLHIMAIVQLRNPTEGRAYFDAKKAAGKTSMEAMRALKRRLSNLVYTQMVTDQKRREAASPGGHSGTTLQSSVTDLTPDIGSSDKPLPGPATTQPRTVLVTAS